MDLTRIHGGDELERPVDRLFATYVEELDMATPYPLLELREHFSLWYQEEVFDGLRVSGPRIDLVIELGLDLFPPLLVAGRVCPSGDEEEFSAFNLPVIQAAK